MKILLLLLIVMASSTAWSTVKTGAQAPNFKLKGADNKMHSLTDFKGKTVVLEWYNKDCPYVRKHYDSQNMQNLQKKYTKKNVIWLTVISSAPGKQGHQSLADTAKNKSAEKSHATHALLDEKGSVGKLYAAKTTPHMYIIDAKGQLAYQGAIDDAPSGQKSSLKGAKNYVDVALTSLFAGKAIAETQTSPYGCSVKY